MTSNTLDFKRCAIYTRKSSEEGLEREFNSLQAQRDACESYIHSQRQEGWQAIETTYDDGGFSGGNIERPALLRLKQDIADGKVDIVLVYKVDRLSRSLADFVQLVGLFDHHKVAFAAVTQQFNTSTSMGRLTLNVLLSFAQFEREVTSERIRDKIAASKKKGMWMGGRTPLGYQVEDRKLTVKPNEADLVQHIYTRYLSLKNVRLLKAELEQQPNDSTSTRQFSRGALYTILKNPIYIGVTCHKGEHYAGKHDAIIDDETWQATQSLLKDNRQQQHSKGKHVSLLAGLLFDDKGNPMSPTHTRKGVKRYRYYISQALLQYREDDAGSLQRIAAPILESSVTKTIFDQLNETTTLVDLLDLESAAPRLIQRAPKQATDLNVSWAAMTSIDKKSWLNEVCSRIELSREAISITLKIDVLKQQLLGEPNCAPQTKIITHQVTLQRCGRETRLVVPGKTVQAADSSVTALRSALKQGLTWFLAVQRRERESYQAIAEQINIRPEYVRRLAELSRLSPDLMKAIVAGNVSERLTLEALKKGMPLDWQEQYQQFS